MKQYKKKPVIIFALQFDGSNFDECLDFCPSMVKYNNTEILIPTLEGNHLCQKNDYIIKGVKGEYYPCKPDIFALTYDEVV